VRELESALDSKAKAVAAASNAALADLKLRLRQMEDENSRDRERMFDMQRKAAESGVADRGNLNLEVGKILLQITRRSQDQATLRQEIEKLENAAATGDATDPATKKK
jgi:hypothetical protein